MLTPEDRKQLSQKGISEQQVENQLRQFREGFPYLHLRAAASIGNGILSPADDESQAFVEAWETYKNEGHQITKFVPASGAASRMFKNLFEFRDGDEGTPQTDFMRTFFDRLHDFAFFPALDDACVVLYGEPADGLVEAGRYCDVVSALLDNEGLGYGQLPKGQPFMPRLMARQMYISLYPLSIANFSRNWWSVCYPSTNRNSAFATTSASANRSLPLTPSPPPLTTSHSAQKMGTYSSVPEAMEHSSKTFRSWSPTSSSLRI